eukprot:1234551-Rhodomonas_salina.1
MLLQDEIKYIKPPFQYSLHQECEVSYLIPRCTWLPSFSASSRCAARTLAPCLSAILVIHSVEWAPSFRGMGTVVVLRCLEWASTPFLVTWNGHQHRSSLHGMGINIVPRYMESASARVGIGVSHHQSYGLGFRLGFGLGLKFGFGRGVGLGRLGFRLGSRLGF